MGDLDDLVGWLFWTALRLSIAACACALAAMLVAVSVWVWKGLVPQ